MICAILGGGRGTRLFPLTKERCKPAVPVGGKYRLIDIPISNCLNSGYGRICVITQFNTASLHRHIARAYPFDALSERSIEILAAQQTTERTDWYQGTADAVRQNLRHMHFPHASHMLILSGDHLYKMDYRCIVRFHDEAQADITIAAQPVTRSQAMGLGVLKIGEGSRIEAFAEKPTDDATLDEFALGEPAGTDPASGEPLTHMASLGIYVFKPGVLRGTLEDFDDEDFGAEVIPRAIGSYRVCAYQFADYWEDIGTISAFYNASLNLTNPLPRFNLHDECWPIYTRARYLPPPKLVDSTVVNALVGEGAIITGSEVHRCIVGIRSVIGSGCSIRNSILMGSDYYDPQYPVPAKDCSPGACPMPLGIDYGCRIENAIVDKNARIGEGAIIVGHPGSGIDDDGDDYCVRDGIVIIPRGTVLEAGAEIVV